MTFGANSAPEIWRIRFFAYTWIVPTRYPHETETFSYLHLRRRHACGGGNCSKDESNEPTIITGKFDRQFALELQKRGYIPDASNIMPGNVKDIMSIDVAGKYDRRGTLTSLKGIEYFESLTHLHCEYNQLPELDISKNTALEFLSCYYNQLTELDMTQNTALLYLSCSGNQLSVLMASKNTALAELNCDNNPGNGSVFPVTAWFGNSQIPSNFTTGNWWINDQKITIDYRKAN